MIDLHSHILPGLDDGADTLGDSVEMAHAAVADGIRVLAATPHVRDDYPTSARRMEERVEELREALARARVPLDLRKGGEIALDRLDALSAGERRRFGLGGGERYLLVEMPYFGWPLDLGSRLLELQQAGITPVLAHPERNADVQAAPERLESFVRAGVLVQLTAASVDGRLGRRVRAAAFALLELRLAHLIASDAHAPSIRAIGLTGAARAVRDERLAGWLVQDVPGAILEDEPIPARPERTSTRSFAWGR